MTELTDLVPKHIQDRDLTELQLTTGNLAPGTWTIEIDLLDMYIVGMLPCGCLYKKYVTDRNVVTCHIDCSHRDWCDCNENHWVVLKT